MRWETVLHAAVLLAVPGNGGLGENGGGGGVVMEMQPTAALRPATPLIWAAVMALNTTWKSATLRLPPTCGVAPTLGLMPPRRMKDSGVERSAWQ